MKANNYCRSYQLPGKENNSEVSNSIDETYKYKMQKKTQLLQKQMSFNNDSNVLQDQTNIMNQKMLNHSKTEENLREKEINRQINHRKAVRNLNNEEQVLYQYNQKDVLKKQQQQKVQQPFQQQQQVVHQQGNPTVREFCVSEDAKEKQKENQDNLNLLEHYSNQILEHMISKEDETTPKHCMENHEITVNLRAKMVDWMIEVLSSYKCTEQTFFLSIRLMDKYFEKEQKPLEIKELHLIGVACMFMACKYEEIYPMKLQVVHEKISHSKLSVDSIKEQEATILSVLNFEIIGATPYELSIHALYKSDLKEKMEKKIYNYLQKICVYLCKMVLYDYNLIKERSYSLLSGALIFVAFKIIEQINQNFKAEDEITPIMKSLDLKYNELIETATKVLTLAKTFDKEYPQLENLKKFNGFSLDDDEEKSKSKK